MKGVISLKKRIIPLVLLLAMLLSLPAYAASPRVMTILPAISFDGTTANCRVSVSADRLTDQISAVIQLWNGSTRIARWTDSGTGYLLFSNSATVSKGKTYELTVDVKMLDNNATEWDNALVSNTTSRSGTGNFGSTYPSSSSIGSRLYLGALINFNDVNRGVKTSGQWSTDAAR